MWISTIRSGTAFSLSTDPDANTNFKVTALPKIFLINSFSPGVVSGNANTPITGIQKDYYFRGKDTFERIAKTLRGSSSLVLIAELTFYILQETVNI